MLKFMGLSDSVANSISRTIFLSLILIPGFHPVWNRTFKFSITCPELAVILFYVVDFETRASNVPIAQYCMPFRIIQNGNAFDLLYNNKTVFKNLLFFLNKALSTESVRLWCHARQLL